HRRRRGPGHRARAARARVRPLLPRRPGARARDRRQRPGPRDRARARGRARRADLGRGALRRRQRVLPRPAPRENRRVDDLELRNLTSRWFVEHGRAPASTQLPDLTAAEVEAGWRRLHDAHALVLNPGTAELRMLNPFSAVPSAYRVQAGGRWWYA